jgi:hypothetical protein
MDGKRGRGGGERTADEGFGLFGLAGLVGEHAKQMQSIGVVRLGGEDLAIERLGLRQAAGLVQGGGVLETGVHGWPWRLGAAV